MRVLRCTAVTPGNFILAMLLQQSLPQPSKIVWASDIRVSPMLKQLICGITLLDRAKRQGGYRQYLIRRPVGPVQIKPRREEDPRPARRPLHPVEANPREPDGVAEHPQQGALANHDPHYPFPRVLLAEAGPIEDTHVPGGEEQPEQKEDLDGVGLLGSVRKPGEGDEERHEEEQVHGPEPLGFAQDEVVCEPDGEGLGVVAKTYADAVEVRVAGEAAVVRAPLCAVELGLWEIGFALDCEATAVTRSKQKEERYACYIVRAQHHLIPWISHLCFTVSFS